MDQSHFLTVFVCCLLSDSSGQLDVKATFLPEFGKAKQLVPEELASGSETTVSVEEMNQRVLEAVDAELPAIKALYQDKVRSIMAEARAKTVKYLEAQSQATKRNLTSKCILADGGVLSQC